MNGDRLECSDEAPDDCPLLRAMAEALKGLPPGYGIRVSIERAAEELNLNDGRGAFVAKFLCWNLVTRDGKEATSPTLAMVHGGLTEDVLKRGLRRRFPDASIVVDN